MQETVQEITLTIIFTDGAKLSLRGEVDLTRQMIGGSKMAEILNSAILTFEIDGELRLFPVATIREIKVAPAPPGHSPYVFHGFSQVHD
jgi:hypothetical protein